MDAIIFLACENYEGNEETQELYLKKNDMVLVLRTLNDPEWVECYNIRSKERGIINKKMLKCYQN